MRSGWRIVILLTCIVLTIGWQPAYASDRLALVIGNSAYSNTSVLRNSINDAKDVADELRSLGFEVDLGLDLDYENFSNLISDFRGKVKSAGATQVVFYYAGHGFQLHGLNHLVPVDAKLKSANYLSYETLQLNQIIKSIRTSYDQTLVVLLDSCRNNPLPESIRDRNSENGLAQLQDVDRAYVVFSTQPGNVSRDGIGRNGPFAAALLKHMSEAALSISELMIEVRRDVRELTQGTQVPWDLSTLSENFYFNPAMYGIEEEETISSGDPAAAPALAKTDPPPEISEPPLAKVDPLPEISEPPLASVDVTDETKTTAGKIAVPSAESVDPVEQLHSTTEKVAEPPGNRVDPVEQPKSTAEKIAEPAAQEAALSEPAAPLDNEVSEPSPSLELQPVSEQETAAATIGEPAEDLVRGTEAGGDVQTESIPNDNIGNIGKRSEKDEQDIDRPIRRKKLVKPAQKVKARAERKVVSRPAPQQQTRKPPSRAGQSKVTAPKPAAPAERRRICAWC